MTTGRIHFDAGPDLRNSRRSLCGRPFMPAARVTTAAAAVTCRGCARLLAASAPPPIVTPFTPSGPYPAPKAQRDVDPVGIRAIRYSIDGEAPDQFNDLGHALWAWSHPLPWHDGLRSNSHDADQRGGDGERIPNAPLHRIAPVAKAIEAACAAGYQREGGERRVGSVRLSPDDCARIVRGILGGPREPSISAQQIADDLNADAERLAHGEHHVTAQQVGRAWAHLRRSIGTWLWERGMLARQPIERRASDRPVKGDITSEVDPMAPLPPGYDVGGWKEIASVVGLSASTLQRLRSSSDPPPVHDDITGVVARRADLIAWRARQVKTTTRSSAA